MNSSEQNPKLPTWLFIVTDLALIAAAGCIAAFWRPLTMTPLLLIVSCVGAGAIIALVPLIASYERQKNEALDDRQRALEALARTVTTSAEQISIAASGLHEIADIAQRNLKLAEQLPHKLQEKIAEFQAQLGAAEDEQKEELERELLALRTTESERLESVSQRIAKSSAEWTKLEQATQQHLAAAADALAKLSLGTASAIGKAQVAAEQALAQARTEAARSLGETSGQGARSVEDAKVAALAELDARLASATREAGVQIAAQIAERLRAVSEALDEKIARFGAIATAQPLASVSLDPPPPAAPTPPNEAPEAAAAASESTSPAAAAPDAPAAPTATAEAPAAPPKRSRRTRRDEPPAAPAPVASEPTSTEALAAPPASGEATPPSGEAPTLLAPVDPQEPAPIVSERIPEITPVAPHTTEPFDARLDHGAAVPPPTVPEPAPASPAPPPDANSDADLETAKPARKRAVARKPEVEPEDEPNLGLDEAASAPAASVSERVMTSDGATRLVVTAYIGIGNRLFIRGTGPGLSWEKGVPLQFISIGKWRWETNDASGPVEFKLYKNDDLECAALGPQTLDPGHQQEVTAAF